MPPGAGPGSARARMAPNPTCTTSGPKPREPPHSCCLARATPPTRRQSTLVPAARTSRNANPCSFSHT
eukprot:6350952-Lingulodinium_polyedra.AAC.1